MVGTTQPLRLMILSGSLDEDHAADTFWDAFRCDGIELAYARNLDEARRRLDRCDYHTIVLDLTAPGRHLGELSMLRENGCTLPVVVVMESTDASVGQWVVRHGAAACIDRAFYDGNMAVGMVQHIARRAAERV